MMAGGPATTKKQLDQTQCSGFFLAPIFGCCADASRARVPAPTNRSSVIGPRGLLCRTAEIPRAADSTAYPHQTSHLSTRYRQQGRPLRALASALVWISGIIGPMQDATCWEFGEFRDLHCGVGDNNAWRNPINNDLHRTQPNIKNANPSRAPHLSKYNSS